MPPLVDAYSSDEDVAASGDMFGLGKLPAFVPKRLKVEEVPLSFDAAPRVIAEVRTQGKC
jgi:hypothetical protein